MWYLVIILFTFLSLLLLILGLPALVIQVAKFLLHTQSRSKRMLTVLGFIYAGFLIGISLSWALQPSAWPLSFWETAYAGFHSEIYGHKIEHAAEQIFLFVLFCGCISATLAGTAGLFIRGRWLGQVNSHLNCSN
jgi:hypothetical protein